jgi:PIN domain nuclease of toxin-antitoxin system
VKILLDTQCWLWMALSPERFNAEARHLVESSEHELRLSAASAMEIAVKHALGRVRLPEPPARYVPTRLDALRVQSLPVDVTHALRAASLPSYHADPFDRLLIAQAQLEGFPLLTADPVFDRYEVEVIPAA